MENIINIDIIQAKEKDMYRKNEKLKCIELFAGIGGFRVALDTLGFQTIWANDIDEKASKVYRDQFGKDIFVEGDIVDFIHTIPEHDLLTGGFPCQPFSSAGKKLGIEDSRGTLFEKIVQILKNKKPKYFVLENVKRLLSMDKGKHFATILDELSKIGYLVEWRLLNAVNFGLPQNRERVVLVGHFESAPKSYLCTKEDLNTVSLDKMSSLSLLKYWRSIGEHSNVFKNWGLALNGKFCHSNIDLFSEKQKDVKLKEVFEVSPNKEFFFTDDTIERIKNSDKVDRFYNGVEILYNQKGGARMGYSIFGTSGIAPTLTCTTSRHYERYKVDNEYRRLTNIEYARIQGFRDTHCRAVSRYNQYSLYGNAVPPAMMRWVIGQIVKNDGIVLYELLSQLELV